MRVLTRALLVGLIFLVLAGLKISSPQELRDRFSQSNVQSGMERLESWRLATRAEEWAWCQEVIRQPFYQLTTGTQFHAFVSADRRYVLKFFRHTRWRSSPLLTSIPLPSFIDKRRKKRLDRKKKRGVDTFESCALVYRNFKEEMGVIFAQLVPLKPPLTKGLKDFFFQTLKEDQSQMGVTVIDKLGKEYRIDLEGVDFILQKYALRTDEYLLKLRSKHNIKQAKEAIDALLMFALKRAKRGYFDRDLHFVVNFGFIDGQVLQIDTGSLYRDPNKGMEGFYVEELYFAKKVLIKWLSKYYPELVDYATYRIHCLQLNP